MPKAVKISDELASTAAVFASVEGRSLGNDNRKLTICDNLILTTPEPCF